MMVSCAGSAYDPFFEKSVLICDKSRHECREDMDWSAFVKNLLIRLAKERIALMKQYDIMD